MKFRALLLVSVVLLASMGASPVFAQTSDCGSTYVVQPHDYFFNIAQQCGVSYAALLAANPQIDDPNLIIDGQTINIPNGTGSNPNRIPVTGGSLYIVQPGDSLSSIADHFSTSVKALVGANPGFTQTQRIYPGMRLTLPQGAERVPTASISPIYGAVGTKVVLSATGFRANQPVVVGFGAVGNTYYQLDTVTTDANGAVYRSYTIPDWKDVTGQDGQYAFYIGRSDDSNIFAVSNPFHLSGTGSLAGIPVTATPVYMVQQGDTLTAIARQYDTTVSTLLAINPAIGNAKIIYTGQRIRLPMEVNQTGPYVYLSTQTARPGDTLQVRAMNFPANAVVDVRFAQQGQPFTAVVDGEANSIGVVNAQISVPETANPGQKWVVIVTTTERAKVVRAVSRPVTIR